ncbi:MAG TPA: UDP-N-acetylmuramate dehydrogenase [Flavobacteriaceae bacterium]|nr:UDP-N-acetylmuramate dehydrogenase [Flavobacteriaceae bacterium]
MTIEEHKSLKAYNTFGVAVNARYFTTVKNTLQLRKVLESNLHKEQLILGGGSNILFTKDVDAMVIHLDLKGIKEEVLDQNHVLLHVKAGENWHELVRYCVDNDYGGIENLSLIPGNTGTAPIQNIGAYGVEVKDTFVSCTVLDRTNGEIKELSADECQFDYRDSIFKSEAKGRYIILEVQLKLTRKSHIIRTDYGAIKSELEKVNCTNPSIRDVSDAVIRIRQSKLPDPKKLGNGGSFFKNPILSADAFQTFHQAHPEAPFYKVENNQYKIPAGWLIDNAKLKGYRKGDAGVHKNQALVLVNYGTATGKEILELAKFVQETVLSKYGIPIVPEINIL